MYKIISKNKETLKENCYTAIMLPIAKQMAKQRKAMGDDVKVIDTFSNEEVKFEDQAE